MFEGLAEEAMRFYVALFPDSSIGEIVHYGPDEPEFEGGFKKADFTLAGQAFICFNSSMKHEFTFTPSISLFVECENEDELNQLFESLSESGEILMPLDNYEFSKKFCWINDRFGVSWQLNCQ